MAFGPGKNGVFKLDGTAGTPVDLSAYITSVEFSDSGDVLDVTTLGKSWRVFIDGLRNGQISLEGIFDPIVHAQLNYVKGRGTAITFECYPQGTASGAPKISGECLVQEYGIPVPVEEAVTWSASIQATDTVTYATV